MPKNVCLSDRFSGNRTRLLRAHYTTIITWVKAVGKLLPEAYSPEVLPEVAELDELETFVGSKKQTGTWIWTAVDNFKAGILSWVLGDRSAPSFRPLWKLVKSWGCYFYVTEGLRV